MCIYESKAKTTIEGKTNLARLYFTGFTEIFHGMVEFKANKYIKYYKCKMKNGKILLQNKFSMLQQDNNLCLINKQYITRQLNNNFVFFL